MYKELNFPVLIVHRDVKADTVAGERIRGIAAELEQDGFNILPTASSAEGRIVASTHHGLACILVAAEGAGENQRLLQDVVELIRVARRRAPQLPIFALGEQVTIENAPAEAMADLNELRGLLYLYEDTVPFLARQVARAARNYLKDLLPPFFRALVQHTSESNYSWHTPGHGGGVAFRKSPVGQAFHQFFGENTLRSDLSVSAPELGSLLDHTGPLAAAEARAARNFGADHTFFVINGTSTANKIVWHSMVTRGDLVLVDRNCHKSILHSIIMTGAIPLYLTPARNELGIIGPIPLEEFSQASIRAKIEANPLTRGREPKVRLAVVTKETQHRALPQRQVVLPKLELHRGEFRRVGEQLAHHLVERLGNTELVTECRDAARPLARDEVGQEFTAASRDLGIGPRELGRIKRRPGFECRHGGSPEIRGLFSCA